MKQKHTFRHFFLRCDFYFWWHHFYFTIDIFPIKDMTTPCTFPYRSLFLSISTECVCVCFWFKLEELMHIVWVFGAKIEISMSIFSRKKGEIVWNGTVTCVNSVPTSWQNFSENLTINRISHRQPKKETIPSRDWKKEMRKNNFHF